MTESILTPGQHVAADANGLRRLLDLPDPPLVSVIMRSIGRASLLDALDSVARQIYPNIECIVVNALGVDHPEVPQSTGRFPVRVVGGDRRYGRCEAANRGLREAAGEYLIFLDDDDWFDPLHVALLIHTLKSVQGPRLAYSGVRTVGRPGGDLRISRPFSRSRLREEPYIPLHAALFHRSLVDEGCSFDESLDVYEDWDFFLQAAQRTPFVHLNRVTAVYRASGTSRVGLLPDEGVQAAARERVLAKWRGRECEGEAARPGTVPREEFEAAEDLAERLSDQLRTARERLEVVEGELAHVRSSRSWRWTGKLRKLAADVRKRKEDRLYPRVTGDGEPTSGQPAQPSARYRPAPLISVILPVFNACRTDPGFLHEAFASVSRQSYPNTELIIVDDGSTDDTPRHCRGMLAAEDGIPVLFVQKENGGQSSARNFGARLASGEWLCFLDQDDEFFADKLEQVVPFLADDVDLLYTDADTIGPRGEHLLTGIHQRHHCGWPHPKRRIEDILFKDVFVMPGLMTIRRSLFTAIGGFDERLSGYEDDDLFLRLFAVGRVRYLPFSTLRWRMHDENYSQSTRMVTSRFRYFQKLIEQFTDGGRDRSRVVKIARRFSREFTGQAAFQLKHGNGMWEQNILMGQRVVPYLPVMERLRFNMMVRPFFALSRRSALLRGLVHWPRRRRQQR